MNIHVLELTGEPISTGGQEMFIINIIRHINHKGLAIDWLTPYYCDNQSYRKEIETHGGKVFCMGLPFSSNVNRTNIIIPLYRFLKKHHYDVVHIHSGSISVLSLASVVAKLNGVKKIIAHSHSAGYSWNIKHRIIKFLTFPLITWGPTDYCACSQLAGVWKYPQNVVHSKLKIIKNGIDLNVFSPNKLIRSKMRKQLNLREQTVLIGHVGRFTFQKNQEFIISIIKELKIRSFDFNMMFIGEGENLEMVKSSIVKQGLSDVVIFVSPIPNVFDYLQAMDVFILPSRWEGLPIVGIEAQASGLPVIVSDNVTKEMKLVDEVIFLSIENADVWAEVIINTKKCKYNNTTAIKKAGYDIYDTAETVRRMYTE